MLLKLQEYFSDVIVYHDDSAFISNEDIGESAKAYDTFDEAVSAALKKKIIVCGSVYGVAQVRERCHDRKYGANL